MLSPVIGLAALWAMSVTTPASGSTPPDKKYHLVYLVYAEKVAVGAAVIVEPLFFTDGATIRFFYDYCRSLTTTRGKISEHKRMQIADDLRPLHAYCENKDVTLHGLLFHTVNNAGVVLKLGDVRFEANSQDPRFLVPPIFPEGGKAEISSIVNSPIGLPSVSEFSVGANQFFLMSTSRALLERVVPVRRYSPDVTESLLRRAFVYSDEVKGKTRTWRIEGRQDREWKGVLFDERGTSVGYEGQKSELNSPIFSNVDADSLPDLIVGMRVAPSEISPSAEDDGKFMWNGLGILLSSRQNTFIGDRVQLARNKALSTIGYAINMPMALLHLSDKCNYVLTSQYEAEHSYDLMSLPTETSLCPNLQTYKRLLDIENTVAPY